MDRLRRVELELGFYRLVLGIGLICLVVGAGKKTVTVEANRFVLRDSKGAVRGYLGVDELGTRGHATDTTALVFYDEQGDCRLGMYARSDETALHFLGGESPHSPSTVVIKSGKFGSSMEIRNDHRAIVQKVQNSEASLELQSLQSRTRIRDSIEMIDHPKRTTVDR